MTASAEEVTAGQAVYTKRTLRAYDFFVLGLSNSLIWQCPTRRLLEHYARHVTATHLDVGVGTGYFLDHCAFPSRTPRVALMDLNPDALAFAATRIARYAPETYVRNVLEPIAFEARKFDSIGVNFLLHCLPGAIGEKAIALDHLAALMNPGAVIFGSTLLQGGVARSWAAKRLMAFYNSKRIFSNERDDLAGLRRALEERFGSVSIEVVGCVAVFSAHMQ